MARRYAGKGVEADSQGKGQAERCENFKENFKWNLKAEKGPNSGKFAEIFQKLFSNSKLKIGPFVLFVPHWILQNFRKIFVKFLKP